MKETNSINLSNESLVPHRTVATLREVYRLLLQDADHPDIISLLLKEAMAVSSSSTGLMGNVRTIGGSSYLVIQELKELENESDLRGMQRLPVRDALPLDGSLSFLTTSLAEQRAVICSDQQPLKALASLLELVNPLESVICIPVAGSDGLLLLANRVTGYQLEDARACELVLQIYEDVLQAKTREKKRLKEWRLLIDEQRRLKSFLEDASDLILSMDSRGRFQYVNPAWCEALGYTEEEAREKTILDVVREDFRDQLTTVIDRLLIERAPFIAPVVFRTRDGREIMTEGSFSFHIDKGTTMAFRGIFRNVTEKKKAEDELRNSEERFRTQFENSLGIMATHDLRGRILSINAAAAETLGFESNQLYGKPFSDLIPIRYSNLLRSYLHRITQQGRDEGVMRIRRRDGVERVWTYKNVLVQMANGNQIVIANAADITERVDMEANLKHARDLAERNAKMKDAFLANISHEIRTPMNAILGFSELLKKRVNDADAQTYLDSILLGGRNLLALINDILDLSKIEAGMMRIEPEPVLIRRFAKEVQAIFLPAANSKGIALLLEIDDDVSDYLVLDELRVRQVLFNLIGNAVKFTHQGSVRLSIYQKPIPDASELVNLMFEVYDTGIGIPVEQQERIFLAFRQQDGQQQKQYGGTGLGLSISRRLAEIMNGSIVVESAPGQGSVFRLWIQQVKIAEPNELLEQQLETNEFRFDGQTILIVEDMASNRAVLKGLLEPTGLRVVEAENGRVGLELFHAVQPDLIIMDLMMPEMGGAETLRIIRQTEKEKRTPVVLLTAAAVLSQEESKAQGFDEVLLKPITSEALLGVLHRQLNPSAHHPRTAVKKRILVVDDEPLFRDMLKAMLEEHLGVDVYIASNPEEAHTQLQQSLFDIVLVDYHLSADQNGLQLAETIRGKFQSGLKTVLISGEENQKLEIAKEVYGFDAILQKPVLSADLQRVLLPLLNNNRKTNNTNSGIDDATSGNRHYDISKALAIAGNKPEVLKQWVQEFVDNLNAAKTSINNFLKEQKAYRSDRGIHNVIGLSSYFGAELLKLQLRNINTAINAMTNETQIICTVTPSLNTLLLETNKEIEILLEGMETYLSA